MCQEPRRTSQALNHFATWSSFPKFRDWSARRLVLPRPRLPSALIPFPSLLSSPFPELVNIVNNEWGILGPRSRRPPGSERNPERPAEPTSLPLVAYALGQASGFQRSDQPAGSASRAAGCGPVSQNVDMGRVGCWMRPPLRLRGSPALIRAPHLRGPANPSSPLGSPC